MKDTLKFALVVTIVALPIVATAGPKCSIAHTGQNFVLMCGEDGGASSPLRCHYNLVANTDHGPGTVEVNFVLGRNAPVQAMWSDSQFQGHRITSMSIGPGSTCSSE